MGMCATNYFHLFRDVFSGVCSKRQQIERGSSPYAVYWVAMQSCRLQPVKPAFPRRQIVGGCIRGFSHVLHLIDPVAERK
jgi:hypothetical protein